MATILLANGAKGGWLIAIGAAVWFGCALVAAFVAVDTTNISLEDLEAKAGDASEADVATGYGMVKKR